MDQQRMAAWGQAIDFITVKYYIIYYYFFFRENQNIPSQLDDFTIIISKS